MIPVSYDFECPTCGVFDTILDRRDYNITHPCPECECDSPRILSAVFGRMGLASVTTGASEPCPPGAMDTEPLADGMSSAEFKAMRKKQFAKDRLREVKKML